MQSSGLEPFWNKKSSFFDKLFQKKSALQTEDQYSHIEVFRKTRIAVEDTRHTAYNQVADFIAMKRPKDFNEQHA